MQGIAGEFAARQAALLDLLGRMADPQERLGWVLHRAGPEPSGGAKPDWRTADCQVRGCAARLWVKADLCDGRCVFRADSDSALLKAMARLLCEVYTGLPPTEVVAWEPEFLERSGLLQQLTENRQRTVRRVREVIRGFALGCLETGGEG